MAYQKTYRNALPLLPDQDAATAVWLAREAYDRKAANDSLKIVDFNVAEIDWKDLPPKAEKQLGRPLSDFRWLQTTAVGERA